ncbi:Transformer-2 protein likelpha [Schistosoma japonicum]|nr:Transformer-2 protein likelpha [Schistosoma japonicum]KAH8873141.1 Transformer-2 protein likelpha [Schistosoma japonicum]KAH8873144.1 Transformer-2 protein likelpha [Schistosoma japonicum]KAH8873145.1 Transformer-2 protein likelpha [Schistosoma japonicum]
MLSYSNRESGREYRNGSRHDDHTYENSGSRKRYRDISFQSRVPFENDSKDVEYGYYNPNKDYISPSKELRRSKHDVEKFRPDPRYSRDSDIDPIPRKRSRMDNRTESSPPKPCRVLGAFGLSMRTEERHLYDIMKKYGEIEEIKVVQDNLSGRSRGFAFIYFRSIESARSARAACARGLELHDRVVRVDYSYTERPHNPTPGVYMGKEKRVNRGESRRRSNFERYQKPTYDDRNSRPRSSQRISRRPTVERVDRYHQSPEESSRPRNSLAYSSGSRRIMRTSNGGVQHSRSRQSRSNLMRNSYDMQRQSKNEFSSINYNSSTTR